MINAERIEKWLNDIEGWLSPPGCLTAYAPLPLDNSGCCHIGIVFEHRFAFFYWALYSRGQGNPRPVLVTLDSHNDVGVPSDVIPNDLDNLDISNRTELGFFVWTRLRRLNDSHIRPALYLDFFSDVYALLNKDKDSQEFLPNRPIVQQKDASGGLHRVHFYREADDLLKAVPKDRLVFLDIDLDFFAMKNPEGNSKLGSESLRPETEIRSFLSLKGSFMQPLFPRLVGLTIALEPRYCGGLMNSLHILEILNEEFLDGTLCTDTCKWRS
jgi:hypothetical protein